MSAGTVLAERFALIEHAGVGGMATVWRAHDHRDKTDVAVKILRAERGDDAARFQRELEVLAELRHPRIVKLVDHGMCDDGRPYMVLEWLEGEDLKQRLARDRLSLADTLALGRSVADALGAAHQRGIVHRDIKPANLFLREGRCDDVKVLDFGVARWSEVGNLTITGAAVGTPRFMAPEQARGDPDIDSRADVFALGCVLYECISGKQAFSGTDLVALLGKVLLAEVAPLSELVDHVPSELGDLIEEMMQKDPNARPRDGVEVARRLDSVEGDLTRSADEAPPASKRAVAALTERERRLVSVVVVRRAALSDEQGDNADDTLTDESMAALDKVQVVVAELGARLHVLRDGSLVAVLLPSEVATDHAARSARCALRAHEALGGVPVALATGRAVFHARLPVGEALEQAAELLGANADGVRIDELTAGLLGTHFELMSDAHGLQLMSERAGVQPLRMLLGKEAPYVGRRREMATLQAVWDECVEDSVARAVMVSGAPGIGKSRLRYELLESLQRRGEPITIAMARGDALNAGTPLALAGQLARSVAGLADGEPLAVRREKLQGHVATMVEPADADRITAFVGELVGTPFDDVAQRLVQAAERDPYLMGDQMRRAFEDLLEASCRKAPTLLVLDDLHWGDRATVDLLDRVLRNFDELPLMVFALSRLPLAQQFEGAWLERDVTHVSLSGLSRRAASTLARAILSDASDEQLDDIIARADGNAFYLEELLRATTEGRIESTPATVLAMAQARLGGLEAPLRRALRAASVFGRTFWRDGLHALVGGDAATIGDVLDELERRELITRNPTSAAGRTEYVFRHGLLRDAASAMLTDEDRKLAHRLAGAWLEKRDDIEPFVVAEHFDKGGDVARSGRYYADACEDAMEANALDVAVKRAEHAVARGVDGEPLGRLHRVLAEVRYWQGELDASRKSAEVALMKLQPGSRSWYQVLGRQAELAEKAQDRDALERTAVLIAETEAQDVSSRRLALAFVLRSMALLGDRARAERLMKGLEAEQADDEELPVAATMEMARGLLALLRGDVETVHDSVMLARQHLLAFGDMRSACLLSSRLGFILNELGLAERAVEALRSALDTAEHMGIGTVAAHARNNMGWALAVAGQHDEALTVLRRAADDYEREGDRRMLAGTLEYRARVLLMLDRPDDAEPVARRAVERSAGVASLIPVAGATLARVLLALERPNEARQLAENAYRTLGDEQHEGWSNVHLAWAQALWASKEKDQARAVVGKARDCLLAHTAKMRSAEFKRGFVEGVPEHARIMALADAWSAPG